MTDKTFEEQIDELPIRIQKKVKTRCICGATHEKIITYELQIRIDRSYGINGAFRPQYYIFYKCSDSTINDTARYIGEHCGIGFRTTKEAFENLKGYLNNGR